MKSHLMSAIALLAFSSPAIAKPVKLLDVNFAQELCKGWNKTSLPTKLGRAGSGWIDSADSKGKQTVVINQGFVGPYGTAMKNIGNFEVFFALAGYIALQNNVSWACEGADAEDVKEEVADIDKGDMKATLKGMAILK